MSLVGMWPWLAGFFDGEGHVSIPLGRKSYSPEIQIAQSGDIGKAVLESIRDFLVSEGVTGVKVRRACDTKRQRKTPYVLSINRRRDTVAVLTKMLPYLRVKKVVTQDILRHCKIFPGLHSIRMFGRMPQLLCIGAVCRNGHILDEATAYVRKDNGHTLCLVCRRESYAKRRQMIKAA